MAHKAPRKAAGCRLRLRNHPGDSDAQSIGRRADHYAHRRILEQIAIITPVSKSASIVGGETSSCGRRAPRRVRLPMVESSPSPAISAIAHSAVVARPFDSTAMIRPPVARQSRQRQSKLEAGLPPRPDSEWPRRSAKCIASMRVRF